MMRKVQLVSWTQSDENPSVDLHVTILTPSSVDDNHGEDERPVAPAAQLVGGKFKVTAEGKILTIMMQPGGGSGPSSTVTLAQWVLFDTVLSDVTWETKDEQRTLIINITKTTMDVWKSCLRNPLPGEFAGFVSGAELDTLLRKEDIALTRASSSPSSSVAVTEEDADAILEDVFLNQTIAATPSGDGPDKTQEDAHTSAARELLVRESELNEIRLRHESEVKEEIEATERGDEAAVASIRKRLVLLKKMLELGTSILEIRYQTPTVDKAIQVLQKEIAKLKYNRGEDETETEEFADETEQSMSAEALYVQGIRLLDARKGLEGLHYLRLAAIRHSHPQAVMTLVRIYMEAGEQPKSFYLLLHKSLRGTTTYETNPREGGDDSVCNGPVEPLVNFTTAQMFDNGVNFFRPFMALALYFYQRAAFMGESTAMTFVGQMYLRGGCIVSTGKSELVDIERGLRWIQEGLDRGSLLAYKTMLELHLDGHQIASNYETAKRLYTNLYECSREYLRQVPDVDARLDTLRLSCNPLSSLLSSTHIDTTKTVSSSTQRKDGATRNKTLGTRQVTNEDDNDAVVELHPSTRIGGKYPLGNTGSNGSTASERFARMEMESQPRRGGPITTSNHPTSSSTASSGSRAVSRVALTPQEIADSERKKRAMFRITKVAVTSSFLYTLAFPLRVLALPYFYLAVESLLSLFRPGRPTTTTSSSIPSPFGL